ncbi:restriction endonuclease subunit S [Clostridium botulinum]|uniref:restriction endonuclease subunit S n=1 Tax=Clostridium botulinum TaxID=1491 RepID=UPI001967C405|nr:restriction endonuclease subunit S [Clostridium botulinum]MBN1049304.1 restriction endonuclease subunit S [Clostridium botulinum]
MDMILEQFKTIFDRPEKVKKLRETILNLAVRGKLVKQDPNNEPASILLEKIREEKERLVKEKKIKKEFCDDSISEDDIPYLIPSGWEWARLIDLGSYKKGPFGSAITKSMFIPKGEDTIKVYEQKNAIQKNIELGNYYISEEYFNHKLSGFEVFTGDILVSCAGTIGETYIVPENAERGIINQALMKMRIFNGLSIDYFLIYFDYILKRSAIEKSNGSAMKNIPPFAIFKKMFVAIPPFEEQKRIVEKVDSLMDFCDKLEKSLEKKVHYGSLSAKSVFNAVGNVSTVEELEETLRFILLNFKELSLGDNAVKELKNCILQLAVQGKLVKQDPNDEPAEVLLEKIREEKERLVKEKKIKKEKPLEEISEEEKPSRCPEGWKNVKLGEIINLVSGQHIVNTDYNENQDGIPYLTGPTDFGQIYTNITKWTKRPKVLVQKGDILITVKGSGVGKLNILSEDASIGRQLMAIQSILVNEKYIKYILIMSKNVFQDKKVGIAIPGISRDDILYLNIGLPPLEEQKRIVEKVDSLMSLCDELEKKIEKQKEYSNRLMQSILKKEIEA